MQNLRFAMRLDEKTLSQLDVLASALKCKRAKVIRTLIEREAVKLEKMHPDFKPSLIEADTKTH